MLAGIAGNGFREKGLRNILDNMILALQYGKNHVDDYVCFPFAVARIHIGAFDSLVQPCVFSIANDKIALFFDGKILSVKGMKDEVIEKKRDVEILKELLKVDPLNEVLGRINGSFTGVILNLTRNKLILFNDKHGIRYLFYSAWKDGIIFASAVRAWTGIKTFEKKIDWAGVVDFFSFSQVLGNKTLIRDIEKMLNSSIIEYDVNTHEFHNDQYWDYSYRESLYNVRDKTYFVNEFSRRIKRAAKRCLQRTNGTIGIGISGGLDTRLILGAASSLDKGRIVCYTYGDTNCLEGRIGKKMAEVKNIKHIFIPFVYPKMGPSIKETVWLSDGLNTPLVAYLPFAFNLLRENCPISIVLTGVEGDVLFGGSLWKGIKKYWNVSDSGLAKCVYQYFQEYGSPLSSAFNNQELVELFKPIANMITEKIGDSMRFIERKLAKTKAKHPANKIEYFFLTPRPYDILGTGVIIRPWVEDIPVMFDDDLIELYLEMPPESRGSNFRNIAVQKIDPALAKVPWIDSLIPPCAPSSMSFVFRGLMFLI
ncbi:MAG: asparagine synthase-related protein, partial [Candidatus Bathyarchaeota archaeon]|nr:asparagine synthase-related protein [Candidatus Bathyarchaeota archaeon]